MRIIRACAAKQKFLVKEVSPSYLILAVIDFEATLLEVIRARLRLSDRFPLVPCCLHQCPQMAGLSCLLDKPHAYT
jgi:hypothetical protein